MERVPTEKDLIEKSLQARRSVHRRMADDLRNDIVQGKLKSGFRLPSTDDLAGQWKTSYFTAHTALRTLVKEGWLERRAGVGTFVADLSKRFTCAAIYHGNDIFSSLEYAFPLSIHFALMKELALLGKEAKVFVDSRPQRRQTSIFPPLAEAVAKRQIQCLFGVSVHKFDIAALLRLSLPTAFLSKEARACVYPDDAAMLRNSVRHLKSQGCRTVGLVTTIDSDWFCRDFLQAVVAEKVSTQPGWIHRPRAAPADLTVYGYHRFRQIWKQRKRPDGLIVWPDRAVQGVIMAALELGVQVPAQMRFVFHRNASIPVQCPFPATWAILEERAAARAMIEIVDDQFHGLKARSAAVSYRFEEKDAAEYR